MANQLTREKYFKATKKLSVGSVASLPNVSSEKIKGDKETCKVLISTESGKALKKFLKDKVKELVKNLFAEVSANIEKQKEAIDKSGEGAGDPISSALNAITDIQSIFTTSVSKFNDNLKSVPVSLEKEDIICKIFVHSSQVHGFIPVADTYLDKINLGKKTFIVGFRGQSAGNSENPIELDLSDLCIGGMGGPPEISNSNKEEPAEKSENKEDNGETQTGGAKKKIRVIKLRYNTILEGSDYDHCE